MDEQTIPRQLRSTARRLGPRVALRQCRGDGESALTWSDYQARADALAAALVGLGVSPGDRVGIVSANSIEWLVADVAALSAGAVVVPIHAEATAAEVRHQLAETEAVGVFVGETGRVDEVRDDLPHLRWVASLGRLGELGSTPGDAREARDRERSAGPGDLATVLFTSGTTGRPKGVMLTHANLLASARASVVGHGTTEADVFLSWLPYSHVYARTCDHVVAIVSGATLALAESAETVRRDLIRVGPTTFTGVPRFFEKSWESVADLPDDERRARLRKAFGPRIGRLSSGAAPLNRAVLDGLLDAGLPIREGYGLTETSPVISFNRAGAERAGTVGRPVDRVEVAIADDGEVLTRGPHVMLGYWRAPSATAEAIVDGWLRTGDLGAIDAEGFLSIVGRKKDVLITSGGKNVAPAALERLLEADRLIERALVFGDGRPYLGALIAPDLGRLAEEVGRDLPREGDLLAPGAAVERVAERVEAAMAEVARPSRVRAVLVLGRPLRVGDDELTANRKVRRGAILARFAREIDALYARPPRG